MLIACFVGLCVCEFRCYLDALLTVIFVIDYYFGLKVWLIWVGVDCLLLFGVFLGCGIWAISCFRGGLWMDRG